MYKDKNRKGIRWNIEVIFSLEINKLSASPNQPVLLQKIWQLSVPWICLTSAEPSKFIK